MTDPLLTIDDATREFRVSPKTIRRRLVAGEIEGAYKRPGSRGPEWVMPRGALVAAGFIHRNGASATELPADPQEQVGYWEQRAIDAEAALQVARQGSPEPEEDPERRRGGGWVAAAAVLILGLVAVLLVAGRSDGPSGPSEDLDPSHVAVRATLTSATSTEDDIGVVGRVPVSLLPLDRRYVLVEAEAVRIDAPRYLVAVIDGEPSSGWTELRAAGDVVATASVPEGVVELLDRGDPEQEPSGAPSEEPVVDDVADGAPAPAEGAVPDPEPDVPEDATPDAAAEDPRGDASPSVSDPPVAEPTPDPPPAADAGDDDPASTAPTGVPADARSTVEVAAGDSFWTVAESLAGSDAGSPTIAEVTAVWSALIDANLDRLVERGNPDLLHVGQVLVLPPASA